MGHVGSALHHLVHCEPLRFQYPRKFRRSIHQSFYRNVDRALGNHSQFKLARCQTVKLSLFRPILQTLCFIIYCSAPIAALALLVFIMNIIIGSFFVNLVIAICALLFTLRSNEAYFRSLVTGERQMLNMYPVLLFYVFICLFIAMI